MNMHPFEDKDLLNLLQVVIQDGNLFGLVNEGTSFGVYEDIEKGIAWLLREGIILQRAKGYDLTPYGAKWRGDLWRKLGIRGIYRYIYPSSRAEGLEIPMDEPFLPKKFKSQKKD